MQSFITEQYNRLSVHVMPTSQYANAYLHLSIMNEQGRIPSAVFAFIVRLLFRQDSLGKRKLQRQLWSMYTDELRCDLQQKGETQLASIRLRIPAGVLPGTEARTLDALKLLADMLFEPSRKGGFDFDEAQIQEELAWAEHHAGYDVSDWDKVVRGRSLEWLGYAGRSSNTELNQLQHCVHDGELQEWYQEVLCSPLHIHVIGDFQSDVMIAQVMETFLPSVMEAERGVTPSVIGHGHQPTESREEGEIMLELMDVQQCKMNVAFTTGVTYGSPDYPALFLFHSLFGASPASRLQFELREVKQWVYQIYSTLDDHRGTLHVTTGTSSGYVTEVLEAIDAEWLRICRGDIQEVQLNRAIQNVMHYVQVGYDLPEQVVDLHIDRVLNRVQMTTPQFLEAISCVTSEQVAEVAAGMKKAVTWIFYPESEYSAPVQEVSYE
ncbi:insulinase family protein [Paenibacillus amylolyticus]|nr:insulinase family protein [Paenibacillus amylolyticus]WFR63268.1 insulinase family protein [Paenibacillus amylolyticus]